MEIWNQVGRTRLSNFTFTFHFPVLEKEVFLPGESQGRGSLVGCRLWGHTELDTTEVTPQHILFKLWEGSNMWRALRIAHGRCQSRHSNHVYPSSCVPVHSESRQTATSESGAEKGLLRSHKETRWLMPWKALSSLKGFGRAFSKGRWGEGRKIVISLCTILWLADGETVRRYHRGYQSLGSRRPEAVCSWSASTSSIWGGRWFPSEKQLRKCPSGTII